MKKQHINTKCVQEGYKPKNGEPRVLPLYQSTTFKYDSAEHVGDLFDLKAAGHMYTRISNPTLECVENKIAALEGGVGAMLTASGMSAILICILNVAKSGDSIISTTAIYGGTVTLLTAELSRLNIEVIFVDPDISEQELNAKIKPNTRMIFGETIANPALTVLDIEKFAKVAHANGIPLMLDNTFPTPVLCRPIEFGCDVVIHSTTKYMDGHASALGGCIVDSGKFNWKNGKFPEFTEPNQAYHGVVFAEDFGESAFIAKARTVLMRDFGVAASPFNAYILNLGLETLALRMQRHCENAVKVAKYLESKIKEGKISWINYPGIESSKDYELAKKYMLTEDGEFIGAAGVISFGVAGGREKAMQFMNKLKLAAIVVHVADIRTSALHPASMTHRQLTDEQLVAAGITPDLIRFSVGIENADDIIADIEQALN
ncbi:MAG: aminotransferase class V-fold PLP-dependent enzyme [Ruminococcaceae bacterium]|nr:aminotransferase class V-fold PLP-dependent enzyme [Oscillospiraceae bacterium]